MLKKALSLPFAVPLLGGSRHHQLSSTAPTITQQMEPYNGP